MGVRIAFLSDCPLIFFTEIIEDTYDLLWKCCENIVDIIFLY